MNPKQENPQIALLDMKSYDHQHSFNYKLKTPKTKKRKEKKIKPKQIENYMKNEKHLTDDGLL